MKALKTISIIAVIFLMSSCVAKKKYESLEAELAKYKVNDTFQETKVATEKLEKSDINLDLNRKVIMLNNKIDSLENVIMGMRKRTKGQ